MEKYKFELAMLDERLAFLDHDHLEKFAYLFSRFFSDISLEQLSKEETKNINFAYVASSICDYDLVRYSTLEQLYGYLMIGDEKHLRPNDAIMITLACGIHENLIVSIDPDTIPDDDFSLIVENALIIKMNRDESAEIIRYLVETAHNAIDNDLLSSFRGSQNVNDLYL